MLSEVASPRPDHSKATSDDCVPPSSASYQSAVFRNIKLVYYNAFALVYTCVGYFADVAIVNSSWTEGHVRQLWCLNSKILKIFPPCNTAALADISLRSERDRSILSLGQFRPEKDHHLQIAAFRKLQFFHRAKYADVKLVMIGSTRSEADKQFLSGLFEFARSYTHEGVVHEFEEKLVETSRWSRSIGNIDFLINSDYTEVVRQLSRASVGLHTMWNEHFGISVVEMMAAGLIVVAHNSGGPKMDILSSYTECAPGYLAETAEEYALCMQRVLDSDQEELMELREAARSAAERFSDAVFCKDMINVLREYLYH